MNGERLSDLVNRPLKIGTTTIANRLVLAPMTFLGHVAFRELLSQFGGYGLLFSEMCSAKRVPHDNRRHSPYFNWTDTEKSHLVFQIFGKDPLVMARAAAIVEEKGIYGIDLNFGCSVKTITKQNCGAAILKDPDLAWKITAAVRKAVSIPLFVKFRTGWKDDPAHPVEMAKKFEDAGADALTFHPRVAPDRRTRPPRWEYIKMVKENVSIPVLGNGNVFQKNDCLRMFRETGCDGVSVGRMAIARPWLFAQWSGNFLPDITIYKNTALTLLLLLEKRFDPARALVRYKKFAMYFAANFKFGNTFYNQVKNAAGLEQARMRVEDFFSKKPELSSGPNMNFFN